MADYRLALSVLIVDDDPVQHLVIDKILQPMGIRIFHAASVQEGIDLMMKSKINLIITDIHMEGMDGLSFLSTLKRDKNLNKIPVVIITGDKNSEKARLAYDQGAIGFVIKPFNPEEISYLVRSFAVMGKLYETEEVNDDIIRRKRLKITNMLARDSMNSSFRLSMTNFQQGMLELFDLNTLVFYKMVNGETFKIFLATGGIDFPDALNSVTAATDPVIGSFISEKSARFSNDLLQSSNTGLKLWAQNNGLISYLMAPYLVHDNRNFLTGTSAEMGKNLPFTGFFWGFRDSILTSNEADLLQKTILQATPILNMIEKRDQAVPA